MLYYDGSSSGSSNFGGNVYISTTIFDIGNVKFENASYIFSSVYDQFSTTFWTDISDSVYTFFGLDRSAISPSNNASAKVPGPQNADPANLNLSTYLLFQFNNQDFTIALAKDAIINLIYFFTGSNLTEELSKLDFNLGVGLGFDNNLEVHINVGFGQSHEENADPETYDWTRISIEIGEIDVGVTNNIVAPNEDKFDIITAVSSLNSLSS